MQFAPSDNFSSPSTMLSLFKRAHYLYTIATGTYLFDWWEALVFSILWRRALVVAPDAPQLHMRARAARSRRPHAPGADACILDSTYFPQTPSWRPASDSRRTTPTTTLREPSREARLREAAPPSRRLARREPRACPACFALHPFRRSVVTRSVSSGEGLFRVRDSVLKRRPPNHESGRCSDSRVRRAAALHCTVYFVYAGRTAKGAGAKDSTRPG